MDIHCMYRRHYALLYFLDLDCTISFRKFSNIVFMSGPLCVVVSAAVTLENNGAVCVCMCMCVCVRKNEEIERVKMGCGG